MPLVNPISYELDVGPITEKQAIHELRRNLSSALDAKMGDEYLWLADREGIANALIAVAWFLDRVDCLGFYSNQFNELSSVFMDLQRGTVHPILIPSKRSNSQRTDLWCARARVAIGVSLLMAAGKTLPEASKKVAEKFPRKQFQVLQSVSAHQGDNLAASISHWYQVFANRGGKHVGSEEAKEMYDDDLSKFKSKIETEKYSKTRIEQMALKHLARTAKFLSQTESVAQDNNLD